MSNLPNNSPPHFNGAIKLEKPILDLFHDKNADGEKDFDQYSLGENLIVDIDRGFGTLARLFDNGEFVLSLEQNGDLGTWQMSWRTDPIYSRDDLVISMIRPCCNLAKMVKDGKRIVHKTHKYVSSPKRLYFQTSPVAIVHYFVTQDRGVEGFVKDPDEKKEHSIAAPEDTFNRVSADPNYQRFNTFTTHFALPTSPPSKHYSRQFQFCLNSDLREFKPKDGNIVFSCGMGGLQPEEVIRPLLENIYENTAIMPRLLKDRAIGGFLA